MKTRKPLLLAAFAFCAAVLFAQDLKRALPLSTPWRAYYPAAPHGSAIATREFNFLGQEYRSLLPEPQTKPEQEWQPSVPLPLTMAGAEEIARAQLRRFVPDEPAWQVTEICLSRFRDSPNWYYAITFKSLEFADVPPDFFIVLVDFSGNPGTIGRLEKRERLPGASTRHNQ